MGYLDGAMTIITGQKMEIGTGPGRGRVYDLVDYDPVTGTHTYAPPPLYRKIFWFLRERIARKVTEPLIWLLQKV
jgi:hypothetical protein